MKVSGDLDRVAIVCGAGYVSGKEVMALELGNALLASGRRVRYLTSHWHNGDFRDRLEAVGFPYSVLPLGFISATLNRDCLRMTAEQMLWWPSLLARYAKFLEEFVPQRIIHTNWHHLLLLMPLLRVERDIYWVHELVPNKPQYQRLFKALSHRMMSFVAVSEATAKSLRSVGVSQARIHIVHNGIQDPAVLVPVASAWTGLRIGIVGQVGPWKGHDDLLEAFSIVMKSHPAVELHIFGMGQKTYETLLRARAQALGIDSNIIWRGFLANRAEIYRSIDIYAVPSRCEEAFGLGALEAAFFGLPVVATRVGGLAEVVEDGATGILVDRHDPDELASSLLKLVQSSGLRRAMGQAGRRRAVKRFSRAQFMGRFESAMQIQVRRV
jgi:glycosyltransferase involved in cell wall biosynthesis